MGLLDISVAGEWVGKGMGFYTQILLKTSPNLASNKKYLEFMMS